MELSERKREIFKTLAELYIAGAEPVGSKTLAAALPFNVSPATVRHEMAELERLGLLEQAHSSSGRAPSAAGYRFYVNELMERRVLSAADVTPVEQLLAARIERLERLLREAGKLLSVLTDLPSVAVSPEREVFVSGAAKLLSQPEFQETRQARQVLEYLDGEASALPAPPEGETMVLIGPENIAEALKHSSVVLASIPAGGGLSGLIGMVGPTRMDYGYLVARLEHFTKKFREDNNI